MGWKEQTKMSWDACEFRAARARAGMSMAKLREGVMRLEDKYGFETPSMSWFYAYVNKDRQKRFTKPTVMQAICEVLGVEQKDLMRRL